MDQLPKLPMLYFDLKQSSGSVDFRTSFQKRILEIYSQDASSFINEIQEFEVLRSNAVRATHDVNGCMLLKRYYAQLSIVNNKFHYSSRACDLKFTWTDNFTKVNVTGDIQLELDSILHNIGALHSELGAIGQRNDSEGIKIACTHFQCAAWVFKKLKENTHFKSKDLNQDLMAFNNGIMLAQGQECILEKSILDKRNSSVISKIAARVVYYYDYLIVILVQAELQEKENLFSKLFKEWRKFFEFKISFYSAICSYFMGKNEDVRIGERVAWLVDADEKLKSSIKLAKATGRQSPVESVEYLVDLVKKTLDQTKQDNDFIFHDIVPTCDKLTAIQGVDLVKEIGFSISDAEVMGKDIFSKLVPIEAYESVSVYSEKRDQMWRDIKSKIDDKNEELVKYLSIVQLDKDNIRQRKFNVPEKLASICANLNSSPTNFLEDVKDRLDKLDKMCKEINDQFKELEKQILDEEEYEKKRKVKNSIKDLKDEFYRNYDVHKSAMTSNQSLRDIVKTNEKDIKLLIESSVQDLEKLFSMNAEDLPMDKDNLAELERLFDKIDEMKKQRSFLENKLKQSIKNDDILKNAVAHSEDEIKSVFEKENDKFKVDLDYLEMNMKAQEQILNAVTKANADYAETRKAFMKVEKLRSEKIESLYESYENVQGVLINLDKGIDFYANLTKVIEQLKTKIIKHINERKSNESINTNNNKDNSILSPASSLPTTDNNQLNNTTPINKNVQFNNEIKGQNKLRDFLPYYDSNKATKTTNLPVSISNVPTNYFNLQPVPTNLPSLSNQAIPANQNILPNKPPVSINTATNYPTHINNPANSSFSNFSVNQPTTGIYSNPINSTLANTTNFNPNINPYQNYSQPRPSLPNTVNYSQPVNQLTNSSVSNSTYPNNQTNIPSLNYQQPTAYPNNNYYLPQQQYLPTNYYQPPASLPSTIRPNIQQIPQQIPQQIANYNIPSTNASIPSSNIPLTNMPTTNIQSTIYQPNNVVNHGLNYSMQNLNLNNGLNNVNTYQNYNYLPQSQLTNPQQPQQQIQPPPPKPIVPIDSLLNTDNDLSVPILKPISLVNNNGDDNKNEDKK